MISSSFASPARARPAIPTPRSPALQPLQPPAPRRRTTRTAAVEGEGGEATEPEIAGVDSQPQPSSPPSPSPLKPRSSGLPPRRAAPSRRAADSTDPIASALTRRFGIFGGLGWAAILTLGVLSEQIKTRIEERQAEALTVEAGGERAEPREIGAGVVVRDVRIGGGAPVDKGMLLILNVKARVIGTEGEGRGGGGGGGSGEKESSSPPDPSSVFIDTSAPGAKPLVLLYGTKLSGGICPGAALALADMRAGGRRVVVVPPSAGFGGDGFTARPTEHVPEKRGTVPPGATLEYDIEVVRVSVRPS